MPFDPVNLRRRVISALVLAPLVLLAVYAGGGIYAAVVALFMGLALREWLHLVDPAVSRNTVILAGVSLLLIVATAAWCMAVGGLVLGGVLAAILFLLAVRAHKNHAHWIAFGLPYLAGSATALVYLRAVPGIGAALVYYLLAVVWGTDMGAYAVGRIVGGTKLAPRISPHKTWTGLFGGMALAAIFGYGAAAALGARKPEMAIGLAVLLAVLAQSGDLFKSYFKRRAGVKDSGDLIPGHGGVLDRIDGLISAAIAFALFEAAVGIQMGWW